MKMYQGQQRPTPTEADRLNTTGVGSKELSGYSENNDRFVAQPDDYKRFTTHYLTRSATIRLHEGSCIIYIWNPQVFYLMFPPDDLYSLWERIWKLKQYLNWMFIWELHVSQKCAIPVLNPFLLIVDLDQTPPPWVRTERATPEEPSSSRKPMDSPRVQRYTRMEPMFGPQRLYGDWSPMCPGKIPISQSLIPIISH